MKPSAEPLFDLSLERRVFTQIRNSIGASKFQEKVICPN